MQGIECMDCQKRIQINEPMIIISLTRKDDNVVLHLDCFNNSLAKRLSKDLESHWDIIAILKSGKIK